MTDFFWFSGIEREREREKERRSEGGREGARQAGREEGVPCTSKPGETLRTLQP